MRLARFCSTRDRFGHPSKTNFNSLLKEQLSDGDLPVEDITPQSNDPTYSASKLIHVRNELWHMGIAAHCGSNAITYSPDGVRSSASTGKQYDQIGKEYSRLLFDNFDMPSLLPLNCKDIVEFRKSIANYRAPLDGLLKQKADGQDAERALIEDCKARYTTYLKVVGDAVHERAKLFDKDTAIHAGCHIAALALPIIGFLPFGAKVYDWMRNREKYRFAFYMHSIRQRARSR